MDAAPQNLMYFTSVPQLLIVLLVVLVLFGRGKVSEFMGDFGKGIKAFKKGLNDEDEPAQPAQPLQQARSETDPALRVAERPAPSAETKA